VDRSHLETAFLHGNLVHAFDKLYYPNSIYSTLFVDRSIGAEAHVLAESAATSSGGYGGNNLDALLSVLELDQDTMWSEFH
jgi:hypothetical protein